VPKPSITHAKEKRVYLRDFLQEYVLEKHSAYSHHQDQPDAYIYLAMVQNYVFEYVGLIDNDIATDGKGKLNLREMILEFVKLWDEGGIYPADALQQEKLYYVVGWVLMALAKAGGTRYNNSRVGNQMIELMDECHETNPDELEYLPTGHVKRVEAFGGMAYPNQIFFQLVATVEKAFATLLTKKNLCSHGE
jgi:hypothetical protein